MDITDFFIRFSPCTDHQETDHRYRGKSMSQKERKKDGEIERKEREGNREMQKSIKAILISKFVLIGLVYSFSKLSDCNRLRLDTWF